MLYTVLASAMAGGEETRWDMRSEQRPQQQRSVPVTGSEDEQAEAVQSSYLESTTLYLCTVQDAVPVLVHDSLISV